MDRPTNTARRALGYLTSITNPHFSGLATVVFRDSLVVTETTTFTECRCESGFGVRQLIAALGVGGRLTHESAQVPVEYGIDDLGLLVYIAPVVS